MSSIKIKKDTSLRKAILQAAITGQLISNVEGETETGKQLLDRIIEERKKMSHGLDFANAKSGKRKSKKETALAGSNPCDIPEDEIPFEIPDSWCWCRLGDICTKLVDGDHNPPAGLSIKTEYIMASSQNINDDSLVDLEKVRYLSKEVFEKENERTQAEKGDIFFTSVGTLGRSCVYDGSKNICFQRSVSVLKTEIYNKYLKYCLDAPFIQYFIIDNATGTAQKGFYLNQLAKLVIPLPSLAVQNAIVEKLEEVLPLVDAYENAVLQKEELKAALPDSLKKAILQEAIQGKLTEDWRKTAIIEETGKQLLDRIIEERKKMSHGLDFANAKSGKRKSKKETALAGSNPCDIPEDEIPFEIPESWCWCRLSEYLDIRDGTHDSPKFYDTGIPFVTSKNLNNGKVDFSECKYITEEDHKKFSARSFVEDGDILFAMIGSIGNPVMVKKEFDFSFKNMALFKCYSKENTNMKYIYFYLCHIQKELKEIATGGVQSFIGLGTFRELLFPLPPLAEQKKIVEILEQMLPLCEKLGG